MNPTRFDITLHRSPKAPNDITGRQSQTHDISDADELFERAERIADEAATDHWGPLTVTATLTLPARGGADYGCDKFTVTLTRCA